MECQQRHCCSNHILRVLCRPVLGSSNFQGRRLLTGCTRFWERPSVSLSGSLCGAEIFKRCLSPDLSVSLNGPLWHLLLLLIPVLRFLSCSLVFTLIKHDEVIQIFIQQRQREQACTCECLIWYTWYWLYLWGATLGCSGTSDDNLASDSWSWKLKQPIFPG